MPIEINKAAAQESLESKVLSDKEKLTLLLMSKGMPGPLIPRLVDQWDGGVPYEVLCQHPLDDVVVLFSIWDRTTEGPLFWRNVSNNMEWKRSINNSSQQAA